MARIMLFSSFTPFIITFLHCVVNADSNDLALLGEVLQTLDELATVCEPCKRPCEVSRGLYRTAAAYVESTRGPATTQRTINLPLHNPLADFSDWDSFQANLDEWDGDPSFTIGNRLDPFIG